jgi:DNA-directed RNA polymerase subunit K/omega
MRPHADSQDQAGAASDAPAITSRFLFVDVAAQRAKQLRRGARSRLAIGPPSAGPHKLERVAMEEVREGLIEYTLPTGYDGAGGADRT